MFYCIALHLRTNEDWTARFVVLHLIFALFSEEHVSIEVNHVHACILIFVFSNVRLGMRLHMYTSKVRTQIFVTWGFHDLIGICAVMTQHYTYVSF